MMEADDPREDIPRHDDPGADLETMNGVLARWAARSAAESDGLIERLEAMGYEIRGKPEDEVAEVLRRPPTRPGRPT